MKYDPTAVGRRMKWINAHWKSLEKQQLVLPDKVELTPYASFLGSSVEGTYPRYGIVLDVFNGYRKKEISSKRRVATINFASGTFYRNVAPASTEPHARILFEDSVRGETIFSELWVSIRELRFVSEEEIEALDRRLTSMEASMEANKNMRSRWLPNRDRGEEQANSRPIQKGGEQFPNVIKKD